MGSSAVTGSAKDLFRRFKRLGVYEWRHVKDAAKGDPARTLLAYQFEATECFRRPVPLKSVRAILEARDDRAGHPLVSPVAIEEATFMSIYEAGGGDA